MDPIELITSDHRRVEALFTEYEALDEEEYERKQELADSIMDELEAHTEMEETIAYPVFTEALSGDENLVEEAYAEHGVAKTIIDELHGLDPEDSQFDAKMLLLKETIAHHVEEEERDLLPRAKENVGEDEMARIGAEMQAFKDAREDAALDSLLDEDDEI